MRQLEDIFSEELTVIGVHSAKFDAEKETANLRKAILRYEIEHPVVNDRDFQIWQRYTISAWPTLMFIDPLGKIVGKHEGEINLDEFENLISDMLKEYDKREIMRRSTLSHKLEKDKQTDQVLSFPGKVLADTKSGNLFISDSNHNRIIVTDMKGDVIHVIGTGDSGMKDGSFERCSFYDPQGLAHSDETIYVADTKNHAIRKIDLTRLQVTTIAGTGKQSRVFHKGGLAGKVELNSPWDVEINGTSLFIAMAGFHQLWQLDLLSGRTFPFAGSGNESISDGRLSKAHLAQPSGIVTTGSKLYFTDSETSAVRSASLGSEGVVRTIVGQDLFTFGDFDGTGNEVRLQHPIGIDFHGDALYLTDTYNNKIKKIYPDTGQTHSLLGNGNPGHTDGLHHKAEFHEPAGISVTPDTIYIADTNNHSIRLAKLDTLHVETLEISGL